jgi:D-amino-acid dehydrogenase
MMRGKQHPAGPIRDPHMKYDVIVLGAGMVGISAALHLQQRDRSVALIDRRGPAEETSYGNGGLIQREAVVPYMFPREWATIAKYALNSGTDAYYHLAALPRIAPFLFRYWRASTPERKLASARAMLPLIERCLTEHETLMQAAGVTHMIRRTGYIRAYRTQQRLDQALTSDAAERSNFNIAFKELDRTTLSDMEPHLRNAFVGAVHLTEPWSIASPGDLGRAYADLFEKRGGAFLEGEARSLERTAGGWRVATRTKDWIEAPDAVVALGPWSDDITRPLGLKIPLGWKRGYHMHYGAEGNATLNRPVLDAEVGYLLFAAKDGMRLTTGAEFAPRDAPKTPVQLDRIEPIARALFPLGKRLDPEPWMGRRPCLPDMLPVVGPAPGVKGLWLDFGHHHLGFTLGPATGRLLAEMMLGEAPFTDPTPYRADRF